MLPSAAWHARFARIAFALALILYPALLWQCIRATPPIFDEGEHIAAGYRYWQCADYGINPEHPPLAKPIAAGPVHYWKIDGPDWPCGTRANRQPGPGRSGLPSHQRARHGPDVARVPRGWWFMNHRQPRKAVEEFRIAVEHAGPRSLVRGLYGWALQSAATTP